MVVSKGLDRWSKGTRDEVKARNIIEDVIGISRGWYVLKLLFNGHVSSANGYIIRNGLYVCMGISRRMKVSIVYEDNARTWECIGF